MPQNKGLEKHTAWLMIAVAIFYDVLQALLVVIPVAGWIMASLVGLAAFMTFYLWFKFHGISFTSSKRRAAAMAGGLLIELLPGISSIATTWTLAVSYIAFTERKRG